jgi:GrpB-like predicted nucleotidyltransferase (UPF0157 family)
MPKSYKSRYSRGEEIELAPPCADWAAIFLREQSLLEGVLRPHGLVRLEHVGSTAIPGIIAKPIVDIVAGMGPAYRAASIPLARWTQWGFTWGQPEHDPHWEYFIKRAAGGERLAHLHVVPEDSNFFRDIVAFRDALRASPNLAAEYEALKIRLLASAEDRLDYRDGKREFVTMVIKNDRGLAQE